MSSFENSAAISTSKPERKGFITTVGSQFPSTQKVYPNGGVGSPQKSSPRVTQATSTAISTPTPQSSVSHYTVLSSPSSSTTSIVSNASTTTTTTTTTITTVPLSPLSNINPVYSHTSSPSLQKTVSRNFLHRNPYSRTLLPTHHITNQTSSPSSRFALYSSPSQATSLLSSPGARLSATIVSSSPRTTVEVRHYVDAAEPASPVVQEVVRQTSIVQRESVDESASESHHPSHSRVESISPVRIRDLRSPKLNPYAGVQVSSPRRITQTHPVHKRSAVDPRGGVTEAPQPAREIREPSPVRIRQEVTSSNGSTTVTTTTTSTPNVVTSVPISTSVSPLRTRSIRVERLNQDLDEEEEVGVVSRSPKRIRQYL